MLSSQYYFKKNVLNFFNQTIFLLFIHIIFGLVELIGSF